MESFLSRFKNVLVLIVVLVLQLLVLAIQARRPTHDSRDREEVGLTRSVVTTVVTPPERVVRATGQWFRGIWFGYLDLVHVRRDNTALKQQLERLQLEQASLAEDARQGQRLQKMLDFRRTYIYKTVPAQVIGTSGTDQSRVLYIDKGSEDGLEEDMPVVTGDGVVGRVKDVFARSAQVLLISDPTSGVGVILEKTRTRGVLKGTFNGQPQVINVSPDERIQAGDRILTSGGDQIFPRGLPVGTVDKVATDPDRDPLVDVTIHPAANLARLEEVLVVTNVGPSMSPQTAKDLAASEAEGEAAQKRASDILSERLPAKTDSTAPADTNPDANTTSNSPAMRPIPAPKNLHADQYTPGSVPPATALTPGDRLAPLRRGTEEVAAPRPKPAQNAAPAASEATGTAAHPATAGEAAHTAGALPHAATSPSATGQTHTGTAATGVHTAPGTAPAVTGTVSHPAASTAPRPLTGTSATPGAAHPLTPSGTGAGATRTAAPGSATTTPHAVTGSANGTPRTTAPGSESTLPRSTSPATHTATHTAAPSAAPRTESAAPAQNKPRVNVVVDGPTKSATPRPAAPAGTKPATPRAATPSGTKPATNGATPGRPATGTAPQGNSAAPRPAQQNSNQPPTARHKGPTLVPDDGSRPPSARTRTQSSTSPGGN